MKGALIGENITIDASTLRSGKTLAFLSVDIKNEKGDFVAQGRHTKFVGWMEGLLVIVNYGSLLVSMNTWWDEKKKREKILPEK